MASPSITVDHIAAVNRGYRRWLFFAWFVLSALVVLWAAAIVGAPVLRSTGHSGAANAIYALFSPICHQISERSFHVAGEPFAACARCTGIYFGLAGGIVAYPIFRTLSNFSTPSRIWLLLSPIPTGIDFALGFFGIWSNTHWSRFFTAALFGVVAAIYIVPGIMDLTHMIWQSFNRASIPANIAAHRQVVITGNDRLAPSDYSAPERRI
jgi:uncharacterized membrane protein